MESNTVTNEQTFYFIYYLTEYLYVTLQKCNKLIEYEIKQCSRCNQSYLKYCYIIKPYNCYYSIYIQNATKYQGNNTKIVCIHKILKEHLSLAPIQPHVNYCLNNENCCHNLCNTLFITPIKFKLASGLPALWWEDKWRTSITIKNNTPNRQSYSPIPYQLLK